MILKKRGNNRRKSADEAGTGRMAVLRRKAVDSSDAVSKTAPRPRPFVRVSAAYLILLFLLIVGWSASFVYHLHIRFEGIRLGYETSKAQTQRTKLLLERKELRLELASLKEPMRIEEEAREKLDMAVPDHNRIAIVGKKKKLVSVSGGAL